MQRGKRDLDTKKRIKRRQQRALLQVGLFIFLLFGFGALLYTVPRFPQLTISHIEVKGTEVLKPEAILGKVEGELRGSYFHVFPKRAIFLYPREQIAKDITALDPHILSANVSFSNFQTIAVAIVERKPYALYCGEWNDTATSSPCYFLDQDGYIFSDAPEFSDSVLLTFYGTTSSPVVTSQFLKTPEFRAITFTTDRLNKLGYPVRTVRVKENALIEMELQKGGKLLFAENSDYGAALNNFEALVESSEFKGKDETGALKVEYIDLRFGSKVFYKSIK